MHFLKGEGHVPGRFEVEGLCGGGCVEGISVTLCLITLHSLRCSQQANAGSVTLSAYVGSWGVALSVMFVSLSAWL